MLPTGEVGDMFTAWAEAAEIALVVATAAGRVNYVNEECIDLTGTNVGGELTDLFASSELPRIQLLLAELERTGKPVDVTAHLRASDKIARFLITQVNDVSGTARATLGVFRDVTTQGLRERRLEYEVDHDGLTGVLTRAAIIRNIQDRYRSEAGTRMSAMGVLFVDLDDFKGINDCYGHLTGDEVLKVVAKRLNNAVSDNHQVARIGGDEFLVVLGECESTADAVAVAEVIAAALARPITIGELSIDQRCSIGVAVDLPSVERTDEPPEGSPASARVERLLAEADVAMYVAKQDGVSIAVADETTRTWSTRRLVIDRDLRAALNNGDIAFHYQPIVDLKHHKWIGAEALLRWEHPELGMLPPDLVVDRAEVIGCIDELSRYAIDSVAHGWAEIIRRAPVMANHQITVNASARQLSWDGFVDAHLHALTRAGLTPQHLVIEVTESSSIELHQVASVTLNRLASDGVRVRLDDFGVGYSALAYFTQFPVNALKIDRSLISELSGEGSITERLLRGVVRIADDLGARVIGEGIESPDCAAVCLSLGMAAGQGWHFGRPMSKGDFAGCARTMGLRRTGNTVVLPGDPQMADES